MAKQKLTIALKRVYDEPEPSDGTRALVFAAHDTEHNNAVVLRNLLLSDS